MNDAFIINDIEKFAYSIRKNSALSIASDDSENLDDYISLQQMQNIIRNHTTLSEDGLLIVDEEGYENIFEETSAWIINIGLAKLAGDDKIECAWDDESNEMVFWNK